jgi:hypothetical protein
MERLLRCRMQGMQRRVRVIASWRDKVMIVELGWGCAYVDLYSLLNFWRMPHERPGSKK